jgi:AraC-like DNA-binding protein
MIKDTGVIYQIKNLKNNKIYVGCTIRGFGNRIAEHFRNMEIMNTPLYIDMRANIQNFCFQIIEDGIPINNVKKRESFWIRELKSSEYGYNQIIVSGNEKISDVEVLEIRNLILTTNTSFTDIAKLYDVSESVVTNINVGKTWYDTNFKYPLRKRLYERKYLTVEDIHQVYEKLRNPNLSIADIAQEMGYASQAVIRKINAGLYSISPLPQESYPIRQVDSRKGQRAK